MFLRELCSRWLLSVLTLLTLPGCDEAVPDRPEWVIHSQLVFLSEDFSSPREPLPAAQPNDRPILIAPIPTH